MINASNLQSGALWRFMSPYMRDWKVGENTHTDKVSIAQAVAASSAFPPVLAPATFEFEESDFTPNSGGKGEYNLQRPPFTTDVQLADGGVYDNLGLETAYKRYRTLLVSDAGAPFKPVQGRAHQLGRPRQARHRRRRQPGPRAQETPAAERAGAPARDSGAYWDIDADIAMLTAPGKLPCPHAADPEARRPRHRPRRKGRPGPRSA